MTDERLRRQERAAGGGGPEERARALTARVRAGQLTLDQVAVAAFAGDPGARIAHPEAPTQPSWADTGRPAVDRRVYLQSWARALTPLGQRPLMVAACAATQHVLDVLPYDPLHETARRTLDRAKAWRDHPSDDLAQRCVADADAAELEVQSIAVDARSPAFWAVRAASLTAYSAHSVTFSPSPHALIQVLLACERALGLNDLPAWLHHTVCPALLAFALPE